MALKARFALGVLLVLVGLGFLSFPRENPASALVEPLLPEKKVPSGPYLDIGGTYVSVELATTTPAIKKGLSERDTLEENSGMLFVFKKPDIYRFWMPNMRFPLDIIWIHEGKIVSIDHNVPNDFDPAKPVFYTPTSPAEHVLEVNAGYALSHNINPGDSVGYNLEN